MNLNFLELSGFVFWSLILILVGLVATGKMKIQGSVTKHTDN